MNDNSRSEVLQRLGEEVRALTDSQIEWITRIVEQFKLPKEFSRNPQSGLVNEAWSNNFGNVLMVHHAMSEAPFSKEKFEFAFIFACRRAGLNAEKPPDRTNRGHDLSVDGIPISLKTQADRGIIESLIHISKFMELGKGEWQLELLRERFFAHMCGYQRIFTLRAFNPPSARMIRYELVEIPKALFERADQGTLRWAVGSKQNPIPGYCDVLDEKGNPAFQLYFDGGTERKLQIKNIRLDLCTVHAEWKFKLRSLFDLPSGPTQAAPS